MRTVFGHGLAWTLVWLSSNALAQQHSINNNSNTNHTSVTSDDATWSSSASDSTACTRQPTCRSATINYITHRLPQQCLTSSRSSPTTQTPSEHSTQHATTAINDTSDASTLAATQGTSVPASELPSNASGTSESVDERSTSTQIINLISTVTSELPTPTATEPEPELETDSPLDNANFLSFDEWKKQNLAKAGQSPDHVGQQPRSSGEKQGRTRPGVDHALDVLGEDSEIELDFSGFGATARNDEIEKAKQAASKPPPDQPNTQSMSPGLRSKDAGKTCKERSNYASFDCAATVLKSNPECKSTSSILIENKDSYMLNICSSSNKYFIVELCDDILIDTIVLANYEFFSSIFRTFRVSVSDRYPVRPDRWKELGVFEARNTREVQAFLIEQPLIWARYLRVEFLTHYGNEYYCPVSLLRVHGTTMMEEFRHEEKTARGEILDDSEAEIEEAMVPVVSQTVQQEPPTWSQEADKSVVEPLPHVEAPTGSASQTAIDSATTQSPDHVDTPTLSAGQSVAVVEEAHKQSESSSVFDATTQSHQDVAHSPADTKSISKPTITHNVEATEQTQAHRDEPITVDHTKSSSSPIPPASTNTTFSSIAISSSGTDPATNTTTANSTSVKVPSAQQPSVVSNTTDAVKPPVAAVKSSSSDAQKHSTPTSPSAPPNPTTQESFFKSIHKRLQTLESNTTLSLQYIESQSLLLRTAFSAVEKRQLAKTSAFLSTLNETVTAELQGFKREYDELWQGTVIELESQKEAWRKEVLAMSSRLTIVADELVFQKRMAVVQSTLLLLCLGLVLFARSGTAGHTTLEFPLLQQMMGKTHSFRGGSFYSPPQSPSPVEHGSPGSGSAGGPIRRRQGFWRRSADWTRGGNMSDATTAEGTPKTRPVSRRTNGNGGAPDLRFEPPTPETRRLRDLGSEEEEDGDVEEVRLNGSLEVVDGIDEDGLQMNGIEEEEEESEPSDLEDGDAGLDAHAEEHEDGEEDEGLPLRPFETQSSPSTPNGSRDQVKNAEPWPGTNGEVTNQGVQGVSLRFT